MVDVAQAADDVVAVERRGRNRVEDRQLEQSLAKLRHPVVEGEVRHGFHNELRQGTCQCKVAYGEGWRRFRRRSASRPWATSRPMPRPVPVINEILPNSDGATERQFCRRN